MGSELRDSAAHIHRVDDAGGDAEREQERGLLALVLRTRLWRLQPHATDRIGCIRDTEGPLADGLALLECGGDRLVSRADDHELAGRRLERGLQLRGRWSVAVFMIGTSLRIQR